MTPASRRQGAQSRRFPGERLRFFYRGAANERYLLAPGVYRTGEKPEDFYFHELQVRCPAPFAGRRYLEKLTYMQHYGAPTRLLDITANPLVALYFACAASLTATARSSCSVWRPQMWPMPPVTVCRCCPICRS